MIHEPSGKPIKYLKGVETEQGFEEVPEEEIIKGYEHAKGHHVLINPEEIDELKLEAKHTIDMASLSISTKSTAAISRSPTTFLPDGDEADEGYTFCAMPSPRPTRWPSANSSCMAASTWSASLRTRRVLCW